MEARLPFLEERFKEFAKSMSPELKVREENGRLCGKWILRRAFQKSLPESILWRSKMPIEQGSGSSKLQAHFASKISDVKFAAKAKEYLHSDGVRIYDKEQLAYYEFFKNEFGIPRGTGEGAKLCRGCGSWLMEVMSYCKTCGASPA
jgi:asparagine synthase (glutamine-hydrolysing)